MGSGLSAPPKVATKPSTSWALGAGGAHEPKAVTQVRKALLLAAECNDAAQDGALKGELEAALRSLTKLTAADERGQKASHAAPVRVDLDLLRAELISSEEVDVVSKAFGADASFKAGATDDNVAQWLRSTLEADFVEGMRPAAVTQFEADLSAAFGIRRGSLSTMGAAAPAELRPSQVDAGDAGLELRKAAAYGDMARLTELVDEYAPSSPNAPSGEAPIVNRSNIEGRTALHLAASHGQLAAVQFLVEHGADVSARDRWGVTPLGIHAEAHRVTWVMCAPSL